MFMATVLLEEQIEIPAIHDLADFRRWALSEDFPQRGRIDYIAGTIEVDMSPEDYYTHGTLKLRVASAIEQRVWELDLGDACTSDMRISELSSDLSAEPDVIVVTYSALDQGRVRLIPKASREVGRYVEVEGGPDLVVEIVSDSSVKKDTERLPVAYFQAGVIEYWLIDARGNELSFQLLRRGSTVFEPTPVDADGYQRSEVLDSYYRLDRSRHKRGHWVYQLRFK